MQVLDFISEKVQADKAILFGNSIGSLVSCTAAAHPSRKECVHGLVLMNCAAGMYVSMYLCIYVCMCMHVCMYVCMYVYVCNVYESMNMYMAWCL